MSANYDRIATVTVNVAQPIVDDTSFSHILIVANGNTTSGIVEVSSVGIKNPITNSSWGSNDDEIALRGALEVAFSQYNRPAKVYVATLNTTTETTIGNGITEFCKNEKWYALCPVGIDKSKYSSIASAVSGDTESGRNKIMCYTEANAFTSGSISRSVSNGGDTICAIYSKVKTKIENQNNTNGTYVAIGGTEYTIDSDKYARSESEGSYTYSVSATGNFLKLTPLDGEPIYKSASDVREEDRHIKAEVLDYTDANNYINVAFMLAGLYYDAGSETFAFKRLKGLDAQTLTTDEMSRLDAANISYFITVGSKNITMGGRMLGDSADDGGYEAGEWIDIIRFKDWLKNEVQVRVVNIFTLNPKIRYDDSGISLIENQIEAALKTGQESGGIADDIYDEDGTLLESGYTITVPSSENISTSLKESRTLEGFRFNAKLTGAIHTTSVQGQLCYEL